MEIQRFFALLCLTFDRINLPVSLLVEPFDFFDINKFDLEEELSHVRDAVVRTGSPAEAVQVVPGQDEVPLLPPREEFVPLLPQEATFDRLHPGIGPGKRRR